MEGNIVGEPFEEFVKKQIDVRQKAQFSGKNSLRTDGDIQYLTNRNAWVKLASSVRIEQGPTLVTQQQSVPSGGTVPSGTTGGLTGAPNVFGSGGGLGAITNALSTIINTAVLNLNSKRLQKIFGNSSVAAANFPGTELPKAAVLFNTLSTYTGPNSKLQQRGGIPNTNTLWNNTFAYGIGGTEFGIQPPPGIVSVQVDSLNRGSIRKANVAIKAHNRFQFDLIELLYLRLGFTMMLEWGWDKFLNANGDLQQVENTIIETEWFTADGITQLEMLNKIQSMREEYQGNVDAFFGKVSNFSWSFNPDGTYDITIDLITLGDVIESIKVNIPNKYKTIGTLSEFKTPEEAAEIYGDTAQAATLSALGAYLFKQAVFMKENGYEGISSPPSGNGYITLDYFKITPNKAPLAGGNGQLPDDRFYYYVRLGTLLQLLQNYIIPQVTNGQSTAPQILISTDELLNLASYFPNQIPIDPRVCVFKIDDALNKYGDITGISINSIRAGAQLQSRGGRALSQYVTKDPTSGLVHGKLMNLYMNMEFISQLLTSNGSPNQEFSLFKFLQDLCNGINDALGGVNKLEPVIKDDSTIVFIDQTLSIPVDDTTKLEVYGYNMVEQISNFVKDVKFVSKITPDLASMISIGATAAGTSTSQIDGTAFSKWNDELVDRFAQKIEEPDIPALSDTTTSGGATADETFYRNKYDKYRLVGPPRWIVNFQILFGVIEQDNIKRQIVDAAYPTLNNQIMGFRAFYTLASAYDNNLRLINKFKPEDLKGLTDKNYGFYLAEAFGGTVNTVSVWNNTLKEYQPYSNDLLLARYFTFNDTFINQGKAAYKNYINELNNERFFSQNIASSEVGFIPLSFDLILDGISGIKIYNKLSINAEFLPSNYPETLKFVITKVNHNISDNNWETSLSTVSMPETQPYKYGTYPAPSGNTGGGNSGGGTGGTTPNLTVGLNPQPGFEGTLSPLKEIIAKYESGGSGGYDAANRGTTCTGASLSTTKVTQITFGELKRRTQLDCSYPEKVFAAGKYQIVPSSLFGGSSPLYIEAGFTDADLVSPENQEKLFETLILRRPGLGVYLKGENTGTFAELSTAVQNLSQTWSSFPTIDQGWYKLVRGGVQKVGETKGMGDVVTGLGNKRHFLNETGTGPLAGNGTSDILPINIAYVVKLLIQSRINYSRVRPTDIPTYYN